MHKIEFLGIYTEKHIQFVVDIFYIQNIYKIGAAHASRWLVVESDSLHFVNYRLLLGSVWTYTIIPWYGYHAYLKLLYGQTTTQYITGNFLNVSNIIEPRKTFSAHPVRFGKDVYRLYTSLNLVKAVRHWN